MLGWEFPPFKSGGLGTACFGLTKSLSKIGTKIHFIIPKAPFDAEHEFLNLRIANRYQNQNLLCKRIKTLLNPYMNEKTYEEYLKKNKGNFNSNERYGKNLIEEVYLFSRNIVEACEDLNFDLIHAHDWLTYPAAIALKRITKKPLVVHIHATEFDRTGGKPSPKLYEIERSGFLVADKIIAVSNLTKRTVCDKYHIPEYKVQVVHNGV